MKRYALIIALSAVALAACKQDAPPTPLPEPVADASTEATPGAVTAQVDHGSPTGDNSAFDAKAFAATYAGTLPCADCPGIDTSIAFAADGKYTQTMVYQERGTTAASEGSWQLDADGKRILLDPSSKDDVDSWIEVLSPTQIRMLDGEGKPIVGELNFTLTRR